ncbi:MAG: WD40 repeat domain-containing protein, partial [Chlorobiales bacterium]|nr:WD40 repeat domain-containing protein [Chlorobiales bacterium]
VTASWDNTARVWDAQTGKPVGQPMQHDASVQSAAFSSDGRFVVTASNDNTARVWDAQTGKPVGQPMQHKSHVESAAFSSDGRFIVTASDDNTARVWDAQTGKPVGQPMQHDASVRSAAFSSDGRFVVTASSDNTARVWEILPKGTGSLVSTLAHIGESLAQTKINDDGGEERLSLDNFLHLREWVEKNANTPEARQLADWLLTPRDKRTSTPFMK